MFKLPSRYGFTLVELLVVIAIIGVLVALLLPAIQAAREAARRAQCTSQLKQIGTALQGYHGAMGSFVFMNCGPINNNTVGDKSGWISLLPYIEQQALYEQIVAGAPPLYPPWGPIPGLGTTFPPFLTQVDALLCPSDGGARNKQPTDQGRTNYVFSVGDQMTAVDTNPVYPIGATSGTFAGNTRGVFGWYTGTRMASILDGTSNTLAVSETVVCTKPNRVKGGISWNIPATPRECLNVGSSNGTLVNPCTVCVRGFSYAYGLSESVGFQAVLAPNSPSCRNGARLPTEVALHSAQSYHPGGVCAVMVDGAVRFISDNIDTGPNLDLPETTPAGTPPAYLTPSSPSRYGVWGALGSKNGGEIPTTY